MLACMHAHVYACALQGKGSCVNWCVAGTGTRGPSPLSRAGRNSGRKEGIETHHEIRASWRKEIPRALRETLLPSCSSLPSPSSEDVCHLSLECPRDLAAPSRSHFRQPSGSWASWAAPQTGLCPSGEWAQCRRLLGSSPGLAGTPYTPVSCHRGREELTLCKF